MALGDRESELRVADRHGARIAGRAVDGGDLAVGLRDLAGAARCCGQTETGDDGGHEGQSTRRGLLLCATHGCSESFRVC
ncbi:hypothetical protein GCM10022243_66730 [Saccharothrix violaceirubra]